MLGFLAYLGEQKDTIELQLQKFWPKSSPKKLLLKLLLQAERETCQGPQTFM